MLKIIRKLQSIEMYEIKKKLQLLILDKVSGVFMHLASQLKVLNVNLYGVTLQF